MDTRMGGLHRKQETQGVPEIFTATAHCHESILLNLGLLLNTNKTHSPLSSTNCVKAREMLPHHDEDARYWKKTTRV
jgi:hypothetical protein